MRQFDFLTKRYRLLASNVSSDSVFDYWYSNQTIFWSDSSNGILEHFDIELMSDGMLKNKKKSAQEENTSDSETTKSSRFHGIALDWIHGLAFWTEINPFPAVF
jgi:hypothetical protein